MYSLIDFRLLVLIACMMSFGVAMEKTGTDIYLAGLIQTYFNYGPMYVLAGFFLLTVVLTQPMSNQAAALVVLPVAVKTAIALGLNPRTFIVAVTYAASFSFITPLEPACVLVYTPGKYRFMDFVKIGTILTVIVFTAAMFLVPIFWPLYATGRRPISRIDRPRFMISVNPTPVQKSMRPFLIIASVTPTAAPRATVSATN
jgi:di/tricarboxylate transporter